MALVLCTGIDPVLMQTRKLILEKAGHTVFSTTNERELSAACNEHDFDVAVIGQAVTTRMKKVLGNLIREKCPSIQILELYLPHEGKVLEDADSWLQAPLVVPPDLAERVNELAERNKRKRAAS